MKEILFLVLARFISGFSQKRDSLLLIKLKKELTVFEPQRIQYSRGPGLTSTPDGIKELAAAIRKDAALRLANWIV